MPRPAYCTYVLELKSAGKIVRRTLKNLNCLSQFLFKILFFSGEFRWFTFSHFSAFFIHRLDFLVTLCIKTKVKILVVKYLYEKQYKYLTKKAIIACKVY